MGTTHDALPVVIRDAPSARLSLGISALALFVGVLDLTHALWFWGAVGVAFAGLEFASSRGRVDIDDRAVTLHAFGQTRRFEIAQIAEVDPNLRGFVMRAPSLLLTSGKRVRLRPFRSPTGYRTSTKAAERIASVIGVPTVPAKPALRIGWFARALIMSCCFLFGGFIFLAGAAELFDEGKAGEAGAALAIGAVILAVGVFTARVQLRPGRPQSR
jgi:hypothetical protein